MDDPGCRRTDLSAADAERAFVWDKRYETGIETVDSQHCHLVELINRMATVKTPHLREALEGATRELADYAAYHFSAEEQLMRSAGVDAAHCSMHFDAHRVFAEQVGAWAARTDDWDAYKELVNFLVAWLAGHILGEDLAMARQIARIRIGTEPHLAWLEEDPAANPHVAVLLESMRRSFDLLLERNQEVALAHRQLRFDHERLLEMQHALRRSNELLEERVEARSKELLEAQQRLARSASQAAIGRFAAGIAHELNTPLGYIRSNLASLGDYCHDLLVLAESSERMRASDAALDEAWRRADPEFLRSDIPELLRQSDDGLLRMAKIVGQLGMLADLEARSGGSFDVSRCVRDGLEAISPRQLNGINVVVDLVEGIQIGGSEALLRKAIEMLLDNALQAMPHGGCLTISSQANTSKLAISIGDTGHGMDSATMAKIFDPFFTTRSVGKGTGLGLTLVWQIAHAFGGDVSVKSAPGAGSSFSLTLPCAETGTIPAGP